MGGVLRVNQNDKKIIKKLTILFIILYFLVGIIVVSGTAISKITAEDVNNVEPIKYQIFTTVMVACCFLPLSVTIYRYAKRTQMKDVRVIFLFFIVVCSFWLPLSTLAIIVQICFPSWLG
jgi:hypothetical protein